MATACAIADAVLEQHYFPLGAPWLFGDTQGDDNPKINGLITFVYALITFQNIVPISLYISIEGVRTCQALFIYFDKEIVYEKTGQATLARSWNLSDDLGQIEYIFSDKTGTLTQNAMVFRQCTIDGRVYKGDEVEVDSEITNVGAIPEADEHADDSKVNVRGTSLPPPSVKQSSASSSTDVPNPLTAPTVKKAEHVLAHFTDSALIDDIAAAREAVSGSREDKHGRMLNGFWSVLALCHTALVSVDPDTGAIQYKAQSPDEAALVQAAADVGFVFRGRDREVLTLQTPFARGDQYERYELLNIRARAPQGHAGAGAGADTDLGLDRGARGGGPRRKCREESAIVRHRGGKAFPQVGGGGRSPWVGSGGRSFRGRIPQVGGLSKSWPSTRCVLAFASHTCID